MGYIEKKELIEKLKSDKNFSDQEVMLLHELIEKDKIKEDEAILKNWAITKLEKKGLTNKFIDFCKENSLFPKWIENVEKGIDNINL